MEAEASINGEKTLQAAIRYPFVQILHNVLPVVERFSKRPDCILISFGVDSGHAPRLHNGMST